MLLFRRGCEQPLRPELRAALGVWSSSQPSRGARGRTGWWLWGGRCCIPLLYPSV